MSKKEQSRDIQHSRDSVDELVKALRFEFTDIGVSATADLLYEQAPVTCNVVVAGLPYTGDAIHGEYSGAEMFTVIPGHIHAPMENHTCSVSARDIGFLRFQGGTDAVEGDRVASEIAWFYGDYAMPSMRDGPIAMNIFARFDQHNWEKFAEACGSVKPGEGRPVRITAVPHGEAG
ncbi:MAG: DUF3830 family protein [Ketobacteraceae bacterium]|nr:DUF3830 family protein [Ketobacteraceae bacterium]